MNPIVEDMLELYHYGMPRRSGRYPWGSGEDPYQHNQDFISRVEELRKSNFTYTDEKGKTYSGDTAIAKSLGLSTSQFRTEIALAKDERRMLQVARAKSLKEDGKSPTEIGREMGVNESTVRSWLNEKSEARMNQAKATAEIIKKRSMEVMEDGGMVDVGAGVERELNISREKLQQALYLLEREGYTVRSGRVAQINNPGQFTTQTVLCPPGTEYREIYDFGRVHTLKEYISRDGGATYEKKFHYPASLDPKRLKILLADEIGPDGEPGVAKDGIIQIRRGVPDLSLGESRYAQVRILVGEDKYLKGMAVYSDNMPDGVDVVFNSNKSSYDKALKSISKDPDNPFGSLIKDADQGGQYWYDPKTGERVSSKTPGAKLGLINKRADEGDWDEWSNALPSQFLGKQSLPLAKKQLGLAKADKVAEFEEICSLTNPTVKKYWLQKFADEADAAAVHLKAAALPGQRYHVIVPINTLKDNEVYAPNYEDGTKLALIRYPHGGTFEIPILTVNNKHAAAKKLLGDEPTDAVGINTKVAGRLSGADFDGDTVMAIPTHDAAGKVKIASTPLLKGLEGFDPRAAYPERPGMKYMKDPVTGKDSTQLQMGIISNLITDMTLAGAKPEELAAATRHSMVVIDAGKHKLDYTQSEIDNNIKALKKKYQPKYDEDGNVVGYGGASTILSRAKGEEQVTKRQGTPKINKKGTEDYDPTKPEGALIYKVADDAYYETTKVNKRTGEVTTVIKERHQKSTKMAEAADAHALVSAAQHPMELAYAEYANSMKALANQARKEMVYTGKLEYSKAARAMYKEEYDSLMAKLNTAELNKTRERAAQRMANASVKAKQELDPNMSKSDIKKAGQQALTKARQEVGSVSRRDRSIKITDREWEAIQAGAISENQLIKILNNADADDLRQRSMPRSSNQLSQAKISRIQAMSNSNYTAAQIAKQLGVSKSTVENYL